MPVTDLVGLEVWRLRRDAAASGKIDRRSARQIRRAGTAGIAFGDFPGIDRPNRPAKTLFAYESTAWYRCRWNLRYKTGFAVTSQGVSMTQWDRNSGFSFHYFEPHDDGPELAPFRSLISVWRSKFDGDRIPRWSDFDFVDFRGWHSRIAIFDITYEPFDFKVKIAGEEYSQTIGYNLQGATREYLLSIAVEDDVSDRFYEKTCSEMLIAYQKGVNVVHRQHIDVAFLELPLSDNGRHATHTIEAVARI